MNRKSGVVQTVSFDGVEVFLTKVECEILPGIPSFSIVGLGDKAISESKERVKSALFSCGFLIPSGKIIINLSPANKYKEGSHYDLPIALSILIATGEISQNFFKESIAMGELGLNGDILPVNGVLPAVIFSSKNHMRFIGSVYNQEEMILDIPYQKSKNISDLIENLVKDIWNNYQINQTAEENEKTTFNHIYGQEIGKRALIIAAAGRHNLMLIGSKGVGKSMLSKSIIDLLPNLSQSESLESTSIHSIAGELSNYRLIRKPPFRSPHSSSSLVSLMGGGQIPKPGEISLAHNGVLFLDELPEFQTQVIDALRTPIEEGLIHLARAKYKITYPANFQLIVSMNPCKCGNLFLGTCKCKQKNYLYKVSAPIQDRIDLKVILEPVDFNKKPSLDINQIREKIQNARSKQIQEFGMYNSKLPIEILEKTIGDHLDFVQNLCSQKGLSGRSYYKVISVAKTIADLENIKIKKEHIQEALFFVAHKFE